MLQIYRRYLSINLKNYKYIGIDLEIGKVLLAFTIGIIIAAIVISLQRNMMIAIIKKLIRVEAIDKESAKTLSELGFTGFYAFICRGLLKGSGRLKRLVKRVGEREYTYEEYVAILKTKDKKKKQNGEVIKETKETRRSLKEKIDFTTAKFYVKDQNSTDTRTLLDARGATLLHTVLFSVLVVSIYICLMLLMPEILTLINNSLANK